MTTTTMRILADYFMNEPTVPDDAPILKWCRELAARIDQEAGSRFELDGWAVLYGDALSDEGLQTRWFRDEEKDDATRFAFQVNGALYRAERSDDYR